MLRSMFTCLAKYLFSTLVFKFLLEKPVLWLKYGFDVIFYIICNLISLYISWTSIKSLNSSFSKQMCYSGFRGEHSVESSWSRINWLESTFISRFLPLMLVHTRWNRSLVLVKLNRMGLYWPFSDCFGTKLNSVWLRNCSPIVIRS